MNFNVFKLTPRLKTLRQILLEVEPGIYSLAEIHKISGWNSKKSVHRAMQKLSYKKHYVKNKNNAIEVRYEIKGEK